MELVDNTLDSRLAGQPMRVDLTLHGAALTVLSEGGEGMRPKDLERSISDGAGPRNAGDSCSASTARAAKPPSATSAAGSQSSPVVRATGLDGVSRTPTIATEAGSRPTNYKKFPSASRVNLATYGSAFDDIDKRVDLTRLGQRLSDTYR